MTAFLITLAVGVTGPSVRAKQFSLLGTEANLFGYATQGLQYGLNSHQYDTKEGLQAALMNLFIEGDLHPHHTLKLYASGMLTIDWIYEFYQSSEKWKEKRFNESRDEMYFDNAYWQLLKEAHVTWSPGGFLFRIGKQIVAWGEMDFIRVLDQINPVDDRRRLADVEFETSIIPIWLVRAEYWTDLSAVAGWLQDLGIQFIFNPNADFIPDQRVTTGNDVRGIWSANVIVPADPAFLAVFGPEWRGSEWRLGRVIEDIDEPEAWDPDEFEYGLRVSATMGGTLLTVNGFYGRANEPVTRMTGLLPDPNPPLNFLGVPLFTQDADGMFSINPLMEGYYPRQKFVGATYVFDLTSLKASFLGGVSPMVRLEAMYEFDHTFVNQAVAPIAEFVESDFLRAGLAIDWKVKIKALNPRAYFSLNPQFFYDRIMTYPAGWALTGHPDRNIYSLGVLVKTTYLNAKLAPSLAWLYDITCQGHLLLPSISYSPTVNWTFTLEGAFVNGEKPGLGVAPLNNKDYIGAKIKYNWG